MSTPQWSSDPYSDNDYAADPYSDAPHATAPTPLPPAPALRPVPAPVPAAAPTPQAPPAPRLAPGQVFPRVLGTPGGGLKNAKWAASQAVADVGAHGERLTGDLLNNLALSEQGPTVLHDLRVPSERYTANLDHVMVVGSTVHIIDSKVWKPGFYWTVAGMTFRGVSRFKPADKKTMAMAEKFVGSYLVNKGIQATVATPRLVIWPSSKRSKLTTWALKIPGAKSQSSTSFGRWAKRAFKGGPKASADPIVVAALYDLLPRK